MNANGIDVSNNNGRVSLATGFSGLDFVIAKASEGANFSDPDYEFYRMQAAQRHALFGAYHFGHPSMKDGTREAECFARNASPRSGMSLWYDYEMPEGGWTTEPATDAETIAVFIEHLKTRFRGAKVGLYSNLDGFGRVLPEFRAPHLKVYDALWLAYPNNQTETPEAPLAKFGAAWNVHQYETFGGIDRDYSRWTKAQMAAAFTW